MFSPSCGNPHMLRLAPPRPPIHDAHLSPMSRFARILAFIIRFAVVGLAVAFVIGLLWPGAGQLLRTRLGLAPPAPATSTVAPASTTTTISPASTGPVSYAQAVTRAAPSVVNIYANKLVTEQPR